MLTLKWMNQIKHSTSINIEEGRGGADVALGAGGGGGDDGEGYQQRVSAGGAGYQDVHKGDISESNLF